MFYVRDIWISNYVWLRLHYCAMISMDYFSSICTRYDLHLKSQPSVCYCLLLHMFGDLYHVMEIVPFYMRVFAFQGKLIICTHLGGVISILC